MRIFKCKTLCFSFVVFLLVVTLSVSVAPVLGDQIDAQTAISSAQTTMLTCYTAAKTAGTAGTNITTFIETLNTANTLLTNAQVAYTSRDYNTAYNLAVQSQATLSGFQTQLNSARDHAVAQKNQSFVVAEFSLVGAVALLGLGAASWFYLGKKKQPFGGSNR